MNILFCLSYPRMTLNILPAIERLCAHHQVYYYCYFQMVSRGATHSEATLREYVVQRLSAAGAVFLGEPPDGHSRIRDTYTRNFSKTLKHVDIELAIMDENTGKVHWGTPLLYRVLRQQGIPTIGCQEGSKEDDAQGLGRIGANLGLTYDYCFCIGLFDQQALLRRNPYLAGRVFAVGLPSNDALIEYICVVPPKGHILLVPSWVGKPCRFMPMTDELIRSCGIYELAEQTGLPIVIKEKPRPQLTFGHLQSERVHVTMDSRSLDLLVAQSRYVIGAPSTLLFKALQLKIPTAVLGQPYMGQRGFFNEFGGLTDSSAGQVLQSLARQDAQGGVPDRIIERAVVGGSTFSSTQNFVEGVHRVVNSPDVYCGPVAPAGRFPDRFGVRYPRAYRRIKTAVQILKR